MEISYENASEMHFRKRLMKEGEKVERRYSS